MSYLCHNDTQADMRVELSALDLRIGSGVDEKDCSD